MKSQAMLSAQVEMDQRINMNMSSRKQRKHAFFQIGNFIRNRTVACANLEEFPVLEKYLM